MFIDVKNLALNIGIIGGGKLGNKTWEIFAKNNRTKVYDILPERSSPPGTTFDDILMCQIVVICINAPIEQNGQINTDMVIDLVGRLRNNGIKNIIVRNRMPHGLCDSLGVFYFPEIKGAKSEIFILGKPSNYESLNSPNKSNLNVDDIVNWIQNVIPNIKVVNNVISEIAAMSIGSYLSAKMSFFKELQNFPKFKI